MRVDQVIAGCAHESSGTSYFIMNLCRALAKCGVNLTLHSFDAQVTPEDGFRSSVTPTRKGLLGALGWCPQMLRNLRRIVGECNVVHTNGVWLMTNVYPAWVVKGTMCKLVHSPHGMLSRWALSRSKWKKRIFGWLWQYRALKRADMFHVTSQKEYEEIRALGYKQPVAIIPLGVEVPDVRLRLKVEVDGGGVRLHRVVFFGRLHKVKAVDRLIQAWELITKESDNRCQPQLSTSTSFHDWELVIAGPDNGIRGELEQYIAEHKVPRVRFVGELNGPAKYEFLSAADLYVLPSHTENFGVTVAEALACGTPVIVSKGTPWQGVEGGEQEGRGRGNRSTADGGDLDPEALASNENTESHHCRPRISTSTSSRCGWWVSNDPETLAKTLREAMSLSDEERRRMGEVGRDWIRRDFSWEGVGAKMKAAYEWLLNGGEHPEYVKM